MSRHLLVIGGQRCGTTYLTSVLDAHPQITMARPVRPEPKVFLSEEESGRGVDWYRATWFGHAIDELLLGEKSTSYIEDPQAPARAARMLGEAEIVALLRDPVERAVSNWRFSTDNGLESRPLETALRENLAESAPWDSSSTSVSPFAYLERGRFDRYLDPWFAQFPSTTHVAFLQDLLDGEAAVAELYDALGVDAAFRPDNREEVVNESKQPAPELPDDLVARLREYFGPSDRALATRLGRALPWPTVAG